MSSINRWSSSTIQTFVHNHYFSLSVSFKCVSPCFGGILPNWQRRIICLECFFCLHSTFIFRWCNGELEYSILKQYQSSQIFKFVTYSMPSIKPFELFVFHVLCFCVCHWNSQRINVIVAHTNKDNNNNNTTTRVTCSRSFYELKLYHHPICTKMMRRGNGWCDTWRRRRRMTHL